MGDDGRVEPSRGRARAGRARLPEVFGDVLPELSPDEREPVQPDDDWHRAIGRRITTGSTDRARAPFGRPVVLFAGGRHRHF